LYKARRSFQVSKFVKYHILICSKIITCCVPIAEKIYFQLENSKELVDSLILYAKGGKNPARVKYYESKLLNIIPQISSDLKVLSG
jgi:hypothetical protein